MSASPQKRSFEAIDFINCLDFISKGLTRLNDSDLLDLDKEDLKCPICLELHLDANVTPVRINICGHMFCEQCIVTHVHGSSEYNQKCPMDRTWLWDERPSNFTANLIVTTMQHLDILNQHIHALQDLQESYLEARQASPVFVDMVLELGQEISALQDEKTSLLKRKERLETRLLRQVMFALDQDRRVEDED